MKINNLFKLSLLLFPLLIGCTSNRGEVPSSIDDTSSEEPEDETISVIVLAGQSNMEGNTLSQYIDPRYGFSEEEVKLLKDKYGFQLISLGKRILRTETAAIYALSVISCLLEK